MIWNQLNITPYQLLLGVVGSLSKQWFMPIGIGVREQLGGKEELRCLGLSGWLHPTRWWINFIWDEINLHQSCLCPPWTTEWGASTCGMPCT